VGKRVDAAHRAVLRWAGVESYEQLIGGDASKRTATPALVVVETAQTLATFAEYVGASVAALERDLADAIIDERCIDATTFASLAGCPVEHVVRASKSELAAAVTATGYLDATHEVALAWFAAHPFARTVAGDVVTNGFPLADACEGDMIDVNHWIARIFLARLGSEVDA
jgi:hypothetical protein